jgi:hypothetical protein
MAFPSLTEVKKGIAAFQQHEKRDAMYRTATFLVNNYWGSPSKVADSLGVLLLTWNNALYRYGIFDFDKLQECLSNNRPLLNKYRELNILKYSSDADEEVRHLFEDFLDALQISEGKKAGIRSPVAAAKALHLLAPNFFPLWDAKIAREYGCSYSNNPAEKYLLFLKKTKEMAERLQSGLKGQASGKTLLKLIDEYNYAKYTKGWV